MDEKELEQGGKQTPTCARIIKEKGLTKKKKIKRRVSYNPAVFSGHLSPSSSPWWWIKWCTRHSESTPYPHAYILYVYGKRERSCRLIRAFKARKKDGLFSIWLMSIAPCPASFVPTLSPQGNETIAPIQVANLLPRRQAFPLKEEKT